MITLAAASNESIGSFVSVLAVLIGICGTGFGIFFGFRKRTVTVEPQPVEVSKSPKRYNHDRTEARFVEHDRRLDVNESEIQNLWNTLREEDAAIRDETRTQFLAIAKSLGRIEGRLGVRSNDAPES